MNILTKLGLEGEPASLQMVMADGRLSDNASRTASLLIRGYHTPLCYPLEVTALAYFTDLREHIPTPEDLFKNPHLHGVKIPVHSRRRVDLIIGIGESELQYSTRTIAADSDRLWASLSGLGWVLHGRDLAAPSQPPQSEDGANEAPDRVCGPSGRDVAICVTSLGPPKSALAPAAHTPLILASKYDLLPASMDFASPMSRGDVDLMLLQLLRRSYALDFNERVYGRKVEMSRDELRDLETQRTMCCCVGDRLEVGLLWQHPPTLLPDNYFMAKRRHAMLGRRLLGDPDLHGWYKSFIDALFAQGHAAFAPPAPCGSPRWYLTHHMVSHKSRVVFNGAAVFGGWSLNGCLAKGPEHTSTLLGVLLRFRTYPHAIMADVRGMFYNVRLPLQERHFVRFLWWEDGDPNKQVVDCWLTHQVPGLTSSPSNVCFVLRELARENKTRAGEDTLQAVRQHFYVDDWLQSFLTLEGAHEVLDELRPLLAASSLHLTKFAASTPVLLEDLPPEDLLTAQEKIGLLNPLMPFALGVVWDTDRDLLRVRGEVPNQPHTRRGILSTIHSLYDPCGFIQPFLLEIRRMLQGVCTGTKLDWDLPVPAEDSRLWSAWLEELPHLRAVSLPRVLVPRPGFDSLYLCTFSDASEMGYAAVSYVVTDFGPTRNVAFALRKVRVAPPRSPTIPRLELLDAVLAAQMAACLRDELCLDFKEVLFWTDSTTVLHYVTNSSLRLKSYEARRVAMIRELNPEARWCHVRTKLNPSDVGSRGLRPANLAGIMPWLTGPDFLQEPPSSWPRIEAGLLGGTGSVPSLRVNAAAFVPRGDDLDPLVRFLSRYSALNRAVAATAWLQRFRLWLLTPTARRDALSRHLTAGDLEQALVGLVKAVQFLQFGPLMTALHTFPTVVPPAGTSSPARVQWQKLPLCGLPGPFTGPATSSDGRDAL